MTTKISIKVISYDETKDKFSVFLDMPEVPCGGGKQRLDSVVLATMLRQWAKPSELVGRRFVVEF